MCLSDSCTPYSSFIFPEAARALLAMLLLFCTVVVAA